MIKATWHWWCILHICRRELINPLDRFANCVFCGGHTVFCVVVVMKAEHLCLGTDNLPPIAGQSVEYLSTRVWDAMAGKGWLIVSHDPTTNILSLITNVRFAINRWIFSAIKDTSNLGSCDNIKIRFHLEYYILCPIKETMFAYFLSKWRPAAREK